MKKTENNKTTKNCSNKSDSKNVKNCGGRSCGKNTKTDK